MFKAIAFLTFLLIASDAHATRTTEYIHKNVEIRPGETYTVSISSKEPLQIGWENRQEKKCEKNCVTASRKVMQELSGGISAQYGASAQYAPVDGVITINYKNEAEHVVIIDIYKEKQTCDSMACKLLKEKGLNYPWDSKQVSLDWKRIISARVDSYYTSEDKSYSMIKGETVFGTKYDVILIWWLIDETRSSRCRDWIPKNGNIDKGKNKVYQFSGWYVVSPVTGIFEEVGCSFMEVKEKNKIDL